MHRRRCAVSRQGLHPGQPPALSRPSACASQCHSCWTPHWKMLELVSWNYWWPGLSRYVAKFVTGCDACNWMKTFPTQKVGKLIPNKVPDQHWQVISIDMIRELPDSKGYNAILMVVDHCLSRLMPYPQSPP